MRVCSIRVEGFPPEAPDSLQDITRQPRGSCPSSTPQARIPCLPPSKESSAVLRVGVFPAGKASLQPMQRPPPRTVLARRRTLQTHYLLRCLRSPPCLKASTAPSALYFSYARRDQQGRREGSKPTSAPFTQQSEPLGRSRFCCNRFFPRSADEEPRQAPSALPDPLFLSSPPTPGVQDSRRERLAFDPAASELLSLPPSTPPSAARLWMLKVLQRPSPFEASDWPASHPLSLSLGGNRRRLFDKGGFGQGVLQGIAWTLGSADHVALFDISFRDGALMHSCIK